MGYCAKKAQQLGEAGESCFIVVHLSGGSCESVWQQRHGATGPRGHGATGMLLLVRTHSKRSVALP